MNDVHAAETNVDPIAESLRTYAERILVVAFGVLPLFFLPSNLFPFEYTKILLICGALGFSSILLSLSFLRSGGLRIGFSPTISILWALVVSLSVSTFLSGDVRDALRGDILTTHTLAFVIVFALIVSMWMFLSVGKRTILRLYILLAGSALVLVVYHALRIFFGADFLPFTVFSSATMSPVGTWNDLALFLGLLIILSLVALEYLALTRIGRVLFMVVGFLSLCMLAIINFFTVWIVLGFTSLTFIVYGLVRDRVHDVTSSLFPTKRINSISLTSSLVVCAVSTLFIVSGGFLGGRIVEWTGVSYVEVRPSLSATLDIARGVFEEHAFFGVGPNKFSDAWRLYKDVSINTTPFWNTDFISGHGYVSTFLVTGGVLGFLLWIAFFVSFIMTGVRMLLVGDDRDTMWYFIGVSSFVGGVYIFGMSFVYVPGAVMLMLGALCVGIMLTAYRVLCHIPQKTFSLLTNRRVGFLFTFVVIGVIVCSVSGMYALTTHYVSAKVYGEGRVAYNEQRLDDAQARFAEAYRLYASDTYARGLAQVYYERVLALVQAPATDESVQVALGTALQSGILEGERAIKQDPSDGDNWALLGNFYNLLLGINFEGVYDKARESLLQARSLNPKNPVPVLNLAILEGRKGNYEDARALGEEAARLKPNFTEAFAYLSEIDIQTGNVARALETTRAMIGLEPQNPIRFYQLGVLLIADRKVDQAAEAFRRALTLDPNYANAAYMLALIYGEKGETQEAIALLKGVLALNPDNRDVAERLKALEQGSEHVGGITASSTPVVSEDPAMQDAQSGDGTVTATGKPDTDLVAPVNTPPDVRSE